MADESATQKDLRDQPLNVVLVGRDTSELKPRHREKDLIHYSCVLPVLDIVSIFQPVFCGEKSILIDNSRLLVQHPQAMIRLRQEVSSIMADSRHPARQQIRKMPFLTCVIKSVCSLGYSQLW